MSKPFRVVIAGRPNVGKSALFNRLLRRRRSLVHRERGMTRDVLEAEARLSDGRTYRLLDTGGFDPGGRERLPRAVRDRSIAAIRTADLVVLVVDAAAGILAGDRTAARVVHEAGVAAVVAANKIDRREAETGELEAWELGFSEVYGLSAEHDIGVDELADAIGARLPASASGEATKDRLSSAEALAKAETEIVLAVVGRPNVGKSSLVNALLGEERALVSEIPGTTRDSVDATLRRNGTLFRLVDTAGIRRKSRTERGPEVLSVVQTRKRIEACDVALLLVDATRGPEAQDAAIASLVRDAGKGLVLLGNKWDLTGGGESAARSFRRGLQERIPFARYAPVLLVSATTGRGVRRILETAAQVAENRRRRIPTGRLNRVLGRALRDKAPRTASGKRLRVYYTAQTGAEPPTFTLVADHAEALHFSESRRVENLLRRAAEFTGSPIRISVRARSRRDDKQQAR